MKNENQQPKREGFLRSLIGEATPEKNAGLCYSVLAIALLVLSIVYAFLPNAEGTLGLYLAYLLTPVALVCVGVWYFRYTGTSVCAFFKKQRCAPKYYLLALCMQIGLLALGEANEWFIRFLERFGYEYEEATLPSMDGWGFVGVLLAVAVIPALVEDFFFRGIQLQEMQGFGTWQACLLSGALFALFHQNPAQTIYQFLCGSAFAYVALQADSFFPTSLSHFLNNAFVLAAYKYGVSELSTPIYVVLFSLSVLCLIGTIIWFILLGRKNEKKNEGEKKDKYGAFFACAAIGIFVFALNWIAAFFA